MGDYLKIFAAISRSKDEIIAKVVDAVKSGKIHVIGELS
jgi:hypothetical protein